MHTKKNGGSDQSQVPQKRGEIMKNRLFYNTETDEIMTLQDIEKFRQISIQDGDTFLTDTIENYINCCLVENNGCLVEL